MAKSQFQSNAGPSQRMLRVGELIRRTLSDVLMRGMIHDPDLNALALTVTEAKVTRDLKIATIYVMPLGGKGKEDAIAALTRNKYEIRRALNKEMALKHSPDLRFQLDMTFDRMDDTRRLLDDEKVRRDVDQEDDLE